MFPGAAYWIRVTGDPTAALEVLRPRPEITNVEAADDRIRVTLRDHGTDPAFLAEALVRAGLGVRELREDEIGLEKVFLHVTRGETH
jgi:hypothetical protein